MFFNNILFNKKTRQRIEAAIEMAERATSGEIRVHLTSRCRETDVMTSAAAQFTKLKMHETRQRNGILFFFALSDKQFAVLGDEGINSRVDQEFWNAIVKKIEAGFASGDYAEGICQAIATCGNKLADYYPPLPDDVNELPNEVTTDFSLWARLKGFFRLG